MKTSTLNVYSWKTFLVLMVFYTVFILGALSLEWYFRLQLIQFFWFKRLPILLGLLVFSIVSVFSDSENKKTLRMFIFSIIMVLCQFVYINYNVIYLNSIFETQIQQDFYSR